MATIDLTDWSATHPYSQFASAVGTVVKSATFDAASRNVLAADVVQLIDVPADTFVFFVRYVVETPEGTVCTVDIGDGSAPAGFVSNLNANSAGAEGCSAPVSLTEGAPNTVTGYSGGKYYSAADTIDLTFDNNASKAKITVTALMTALKGA